MATWLWDVFDRWELVLSRSTEAIVMRVPARGGSVLNPLTWGHRLVDLLLSLVLFVPRHVVLVLVVGVGMVISKAGSRVGAWGYTGGGGKTAA